MLNPHGDVNKWVIMLHGHALFVPNEITLAKIVISLFYIVNYS